MKPGRVCQYSSLSLESKRAGLSRRAEFRRGAGRRLRGNDSSWAQPLPSPRTLPKRDLGAGKKPKRVLVSSAQSLSPLTWSLMPAPTSDSTLCHLSQAPGKVQPRDRASPKRVLPEVTSKGMGVGGSKRVGDGLSYLSCDTEEAPGATDEASQEPRVATRHQPHHGPGRDSER